MSEAKVLKFPNKKEKHKRALHSSGRVPLHFRYKDINGVSRQKTVYGKTEAEAERKKKAFLSAVDLGLRMEEQGRSVSSWADEWLTVYKKPRVGEKRLKSLKYEVDRLKASIGQKPLKAVTQSDLQRILNSRIGLSQGAINITAGVIRGIFDSAAKNRLISVSPTDGLIVPKGPAGSHREISREEIDIIIKTAQTGHRFGVAAMLMLFAGLRRGEVCALRTQDIGREVIRVSSSISFARNHGEIKEPKTEAGKREVPIMPPLRPFLTGIDGWIISHQNDGAISLTAFENAYASFLRVCAKIAGRPISFRCHDLRHTYATMLYDAGVDVKTAQKWLGHASPTLTLALYTHLSQQRQKASIDAASKYFSTIAGCNSGSTKKKYRLKRK